MIQQLTNVIFIFYFKLLKYAYTDIYIYIGTNETII